MRWQTPSTNLWGHNSGCVKSGQPAISASLRRSACHLSLIRASCAWAETLFAAIWQEQTHIWSVSPPVKFPHRRNCYWRTHSVQIYTGSLDLPFILNAIELPSQPHTWNAVPQAVVTVSSKCLPNIPFPRELKMSFSQWVERSQIKFHLAAIIRYTWKGL